MTTFRTTNPFFCANTGPFFPCQFIQEQFASNMVASSFQGMPQAMQARAIGLPFDMRQLVDLSQANFSLGCNSFAVESLSAGHGRGISGYSMDSFQPTNHAIHGGHHAFVANHEISKQRALEEESQNVSSSTSNDGDIKATSKITCTSKVFPRRKNGQLRRELSRPVVLTEEVLRQYFNTPLRKTAKELGICATALKKVCRSLGIQKWPYRSLYTHKATADDQHDDATDSEHGHSPPPSENSNAGSHHGKLDAGAFSAVSTATSSPQFPIVQDDHSQSAVLLRPTARASAFKACPQSALSTAAFSSAGAALLCEIQASLAAGSSGSSAGAYNLLSKAATTAEMPQPCSDNSIGRLLN